MWNWLQKSDNFMPNSADERAELQAALDQLEAEFQKDLERVQRQVRKKAFTREITRARRYHEEKSIWEYVNNIVEDIHLFTWRKTAIASCTNNFHQKRHQLEQEFRELDAQHRKERIFLRYSLPTEGEDHGQDVQSPEPHGSLP